MTRIVLLVLAALTVSAGCANPARTISLNAYRNAVAEGVTAELDRRGIAPAGRPRCVTPGTGHVQRGEGFATHCSGSTVDGIRVTLTGRVTEVGTERQAERYTLWLDNRILFTAPCLGEGCPRS